MLLANQYTKGNNRFISCGVSSKMNQYHKTDPNAQVITILSEKATEKGFFYLTNINIGCYYTYMQAKLINHNKLLYSDGSILETKIWMVSKSQRLPRGYKSSLVYIKDGERVIGYDNAEGKGDHRHYCNNEEPYVFISLKQLINDFMADVKKIKGDLP